VADASAMKVMPSADTTCRRSCLPRWQPSASPPVRQLKMDGDGDVHRERVGVTPGEFRCPCRSISVLTLATSSRESSARRAEIGHKPPMVPSDATTHCQIRLAHAR
jgi:hypothetical protein